MSQFTPTANSTIARGVLPLEYKIVLNYAEKLGLREGYFQDATSSSSAFIPEF